MDDESFAFEQVECECPLVAEEVREMAEASGTWRIEWENGDTRETSMVGLAWYAREFDDKAEVSPVLVEGEKPNESDDSEVSPAC